MATVSELDDRIEKCQRILDSDPNSQIFAALAEAHRKKGDLDLAFRVCKNGLKVHDDYGSAHVVMSKINLDRGQYDWAEIEAKRAADLDGRTRSVELLLSEIYIYKGEFSHAIKLLKELLSRDPENPQIQKLLEIAQKIPEEQNAYLDETIITGGPSSSSSVSPSVIDETEIEIEAETSKPLELHDILTEALTIKGLRANKIIENRADSRLSRTNPPTNEIRQRNRNSQPAGRTKSVNRIPATTGIRKKSPGYFLSTTAYGK